MEKPLKLIQVGVGFWGWSWVQVALDSPYWELAGIVELKKENRERAAEHYGFGSGQVFGSLRKAAAELEPDGALVAVGQEVHRSVAVEALELGLNVLVEKPMAMSMEDGRAMVEAADKSGKKLMVSQNYRYKRAPRTIKGFLDKDTIGKVGAVYIDFQKAPALSGFRVEMEEPLLIDMSIHHFDQIRHLLQDEPVRVRAYSWNTDWSIFRGNALASVVFEMKSGAVVAYTGNWVSRGRETSWDGDWYFHCSGGQLRWTKNEVAFRTNNLLQEVYTRGALERGGELDLELTVMEWEDRWACLEELARSIRENREPETSGRDNLSTLAMVIGACRSVKEGRPVTIAEALDS